MNGRQRFISIVIPCYNAEHEIGNCLNAVFDSRYRDFEVICVDDCSQDRTVEVISGFKNVIPVRLKKNVGAAVARNRGVERARGDIILFIDSDILIEKDTLEKINRAFEEDRGDVIVGIYSVKHPFKGVSTNFKNLHLHYTYWIMPDYIPIINTSCAALKREAFRAVSGFDDNIRILTGEDWDLGQRIASSGYRIYLDKALFVVHRKNFNLRTLLKTDLRKAFGQVKLVLRARKRKVSLSDRNRVGSLPGYIFASAPIVTLMSAFFMLAAVEPTPLSLMLLMCSIALYGITNRKFFLFLARTRGGRFGLLSAGVYFLNIWVMIVGGALGLVDYVVRGKRY